MTGPRVTLLNDTTSCNHHGCHVVVRQIREHCKIYGLDLWHSVKHGDDWQSERHLKRLEKSDIVLVNGEGSFHNDRKLALVLAQSAPFCRERNIPCVLINSVYQDNGDEMARLVRQFDRVFVRETRSQAVLRKERIDSDVVPDLTLSHPDLSPQAARKGLIVTDSSCEEATRELQQFCTRANGVEGATLFRPNSTARALRVFAARMLGKRAPKRWRYELRQSSQQHSPIAAPLEPSDALFRRISGARLIVTGRFHMVCLAMLARTPFIALPGNTHKTEGLLEDANLSRRFAHSLPDGGHFSGADWHDDEVELVEAYLKRARSGALQMFAAIRQLAADR